MEKYKEFLLKIKETYIKRRDMGRLGGISMSEVHRITKNIYQNEEERISIIKFLERTNQIRFDKRNSMVIPTFLGEQEEILSNSSSKELGKISNNGIFKVLEIFGPMRKGEIANKYIKTIDKDADSYKCTRRVRTLYEKGLLVRNSDVYSLPEGKGDKEKPLTQFLEGSP